MVTMDTLRDALLKIFGIDEKYLVPLTGNWFDPSDDKYSTWIGYVIVRTKPIIRSTPDGVMMTKNLRSIIRLVALGPQAELFINSTLLWDDRQDVQAILEKLEAQLNYIDREIYTKSYKREGMNDELAWCTDIEAQHFIAVDTKWKPWCHSAPLEPWRPPSLEVMVDDNIRRP